MSDDASFVVVTRGDAPLILSFPHTGTDLPGAYATRFVSPWLARQDADWHVEQLYGFAVALGATCVRTTVSRSVIDVNRDPSGASLYPGQVTTGLCPTETFEGAPLYRPGEAPDESEIAARRAQFFDPFHAALGAEIARLRAIHPRVVLYDCHSIRSVLPRLFPGTLPQFNIGTNAGAACDARVAAAVEGPCAASGLGHVVDGRFKGGWITRHYGAPADGVHAIQMELAWRGYLREPAAVTPETWPVAYDPAHAEPVRAVLQRALDGLLAFARG
ncbi:N-formylglutamate deformylase [Siculibacillus lacustris]|uniref:N-formylglutamate deformylase n=1 Tax=Siculibacillus lacustris TaxID=1549641 RepID=A0A4Q9VYD8_9HYPH|nr:N-formylglutamate deformylase [Siculibacillus lacustris]TBW41042.1 N-formylglutamate deformylase [Siculibacillus lacustris]